MKKSELRKIIKEELLKEEKFRAIDYNKIEKFDDFVSWPLKEAKKYGGLRDIKMDANIGNLIM